MLRSLLMILSALVVGVAILGYTPLPDGIGEPYKAHLIQGGMKITWFLGRVGQYLGFGRSILNMKSLTASRLDREPGTASYGDVKVTRDKITDIPVTIYQPKTAITPSPAVVFFHGGGWVIGSPDLYDETIYYYAKTTNLIIFSVDYRMAPEHVFPAAAEDCLSVTRHILRHGDQYGVDVNKVGVSGDSAGGNLAAVVALRLSQEKSDLPPLKFQILHYPVLQAFDLRLPSHIDYELPLLTIEVMNVMLGLYFGLDDENLDHFVTVARENRHISPEMRKSKYAEFVNVKLLPKEFQTPNSTVPEVTALYDEKVFSKIKNIVTDPLFSPLLSPQLSGPPALVHVCEFDILRDDALLYARRLQDAGVQVEVHFAKGGYHADMIKSALDFFYPKSGEDAILAASRFIKKILKL